MAKMSMPVPEVPLMEIHRRYNECKGKYRMYNDIRNNYYGNVLKFPE